MGVSNKPRKLPMRAHVSYFILISIRATNICTSLPGMHRNLKTGTVTPHTESHTCN